MVLLGSNGEKYIPPSMPAYKPAPAKVAAKKPKKPATTTVKPSSRVVSSRYVTTPTTSYNTKPTTTTTKPTTTASPNLSTLTNNYLTQLTANTNKVYDQQKTATLAQMKADQQAAVAKLNGQKKDTAVSYQGQRNQADVVAAQNVQKLRELMAANGLNASGENVTAQASANSDRQGAINALNLQEQSAIRNINDQINDVNNPAKQQAALAQIEAQRSQALLDAKNNAQEKAWREYTYNNMSAAEKAQLEWAKQQYGEDAAWRMYELQYSTAASTAQSQAEVNAYTGGNATTTGGGTAKVSGPASFQTHMQTAIKRGVPAEWAPLLSEIVRRESSYNPYAKNPTSTAYGYGQFLTSTRNNYEKKTGLDYNDPVNQLIMMYQYVKDRYGSPQNALNFWNKNHWYLLPLLTGVSLLSKFVLNIF
ncbi:hypothetical protein L1999_20135 [Neobacillus drentensis]|uniref:aggregation-promoting factor C-terminal-like domain-containing protein n=1 Tax=Neobacillus drentensis TaxID=220684 RepID=UPI001F3F3C2B|nr:hypothetical protein [Neobacillus drentensis]ULT55393.1 hypothetical protein L1999_20135 [Neobacillus drentensis]